MTCQLHSTFRRNFLDLFRRKISLLVTWSCEVTPRILRKHRWWNVDELPGTAIVLSWYQLLNLTRSPTLKHHGHIIDSAIHNTTSEKKELLRGQRKGKNPNPKWVKCKYQSAECFNKSVFLMCTAMARWCGAEDRWRKHKLSQCEPLYFIMFPKR